MGAKIRHIVSVNDFSRGDLEHLFKKARMYKKMLARDPKSTRGPLAGVTVAPLFYEPSTRTRGSFESAVLRLGGEKISTENAAEFSSAMKGESLADTIRVYSGYADIIVLRHPIDGAAVIAARYAAVPVVNAGDGANEHPTQALLDFFTLWEAVESGRLPRRLRVCFFGDNAKSRTVRSLAWMLALHAKSFDIDIARISFGGYGTAGTPSRNVVDGLSTAGIVTQDIGSDLAAFEEADVLYLTRFQDERRDNGDVKKNGLYLEGLPPGHTQPFTFGPEHAERMPERAIIMHPLPRAGELSPATDADPRAHYFEQSDNGVPTRMALLDALMNGWY